MLGWGRRGALRGRTHVCPAPRVRSYSADAAAAAALKHTSLRVEKTVPSKSRVVIIGGGAIGCSVAYHLTKLGWNDVLLLEQGPGVSCGTSWHAAGLVGQLRATSTEVRLSCYGSQLYSTLAAETGQETGWKRCGSITVARGPERMHNLQLNHSRARAFGIDAELVSPQEAKRLSGGMLHVDDLVGGLWLPGDGTVNPSDLTQAYAKGAKSRGATIIEGVGVTSVETKEGAVASVTTSTGQRVECEYIVNCAGQWARQVGKMCGVHVPLHSCEHYYVVTKPLPDFPDINNLPVMRDPDGWIYYREWSGGLCLGGFEPHAKPCFENGIPDKFEFALLPEDWAHFEVLMNEGLLRTPVLQKAEIRQMVNGPESFTPDNQYILGPAPEVRNYWVAAGFNSSGIASSGGAAKALTEWMVQGHPSMDMWTVDIRRFSPFQSNPAFLRARCAESLGVHYSINWPRRELTSGRPLRRSGLYDRLRDAGACFGNRFGWERPNWFAPGQRDPVQLNSWSKPNWYEYSASEHQAAREAVAIFDMTSFAKFLFQGPDAERTLQHLCANNVAVPPGRLVYTGMLNERGGYELDCTVQRWSENEFLVVSATNKATRDAHWFRTATPPSHRTVATDVTSAWAVLAVMGPKSRELMSKVTTCDLSNEAFPFGSTKEIDVGLATCRAARVTYVGELGWELYIPMEFAAAAYDTLMAAGADLGVKNAGYYAIESLRVEKAYRAWGHDITPDETPLHAGLKFAVDMGKGNFMGRDALLRQEQAAAAASAAAAAAPTGAGTGLVASAPAASSATAAGVSKRLVVFTLDDPAAYPLGGEPILRDGNVCGYLTSAVYGPTVGRGVGLGYVNHSEPVKGFAAGWIKNSKWSIELAGKQVAATASLKAAYDPENRRTQM